MRRPVAPLLAARSVRLPQPARSLLYAVHQSLWRPWARFRYAGEFLRVERFCLFVGYPRSGHSLVGAFLNAHRHAVVSHELNVGPLVLAGISRDALYAR